MDGLDKALEFCISCGPLKADGWSCVGYTTQPNAMSVCSNCPWRVEITMLAGNTPGVLSGTTMTISGSKLDIFYRRGEDNKCHPNQFAQKKMEWVYD